MNTQTPSNASNFMPGEPTYTPKPTDVVAQIHGINITSDMANHAAAALGTAIRATVHDHGHHPVMHACVAAFNEWKSHKAEHTPVTHSDADKHPPVATQHGEKPAPTRTGKGCFG